MVTDYTIIGIEKVNYTNKDGRTIKGVRLHLSYTKEFVDGLCVDNVFVSEEIAKGLSVGVCIVPLYNKYGRIAQINIVE